MLYDDWMKLAETLGFNMVLLPLKKEIRANFNQTKVWEAYNDIEGAAYGYPNFMFGWIDTQKDNFPDVVDIQFSSIVLKYLESIAPGIPETMFYKGWNKRLGTENLNMDGIWEELYKRNQTLSELSAIPENDNWRHNSDKISLTCGSLIAYLYRAAGIFGDSEINSTEFTPRDVYELNFFGVGPEYIAPECQGNAPHGYCQIMGNMDFDLGKFNFVDPYSHMNEKCPSLAPDFDRSEGC